MMRLTLPSQCGLWRLAACTAHLYARFRKPWTLIKIWHHWTLIEAATDLFHKEMHLACHRVERMEVELLLKSGAYHPLGKLPHRGEETERPLVLEELC